tara:strand:- start:2561 stop:3457 length:897 start_codon:yes stop_codon:yes gene_type:complete
MNFKPAYTKKDNSTNYDSVGSNGLGEGVVRTIVSEDIEPSDPYGGDRAIAEFSRGSLRAETNQLGTQNKKFGLSPSLAAVSSDFAYPDSLRTAKHPVPSFWVYDGAQPTIGATGKTFTSREQMLPNKRITEQDAVEWQRVGSKKGWMFNGSPQQQGPGGSGENIPTHTDDGFVESIRKNKWTPNVRSQENQELAIRQMPAIDIENNARGIGLTGAGTGNGGMAGGYKEVNKARLAALPVPMAKYNWTGTRVLGTGREDMGVGQGAGGFRSGYKSIYPDRPSFPMRRTTGISRVTQNAA